MVGFTGVIWLPRGAAKLSLDLTTGAGSIALSNAGAAWSALAAALSESALTLEKANLELRLGFEGEAAEAAYEKIEPFTGWVGGTAALAALCASKAEAQAQAYNIAVLAMPNIAEVEAIHTAKVAALAAGGVLTGASAAVEAVEQAEDVRAALVMEAYETASSVLALPINFPREPVMVRDDSVLAESPTKQATPEDISTEADGEATTAASVGGVDIPAALRAAPGLASAGLHSVSSTISSGSAAIGSVVPTSASAAGASAAAAMGGFGAPMGMGALGQQNESTRSAAAQYRGLGNSTTGLGVGTPGLAAFGSDGSVGSNEPSGSSRSEITSGVRNVGAGSPIIGGRPVHNNDEETRSARVAPNQRFEYFADGRVVAPAVIGALDPDEE